MISGIVFYIVIVGLLAYASYLKHQIKKKVVAGDGGAKHRSIDPPTTWHSVADPHAVSYHRPRGGPPVLDPTTRPIGAYDVYSVVEANNFGKEFLRMAGIVQMLHARPTPSDKYPYHAHPKRTRQPQSTRAQARSSCTVSLAVPGPCHTVLALCHNPFSRCLLTCPIWLILTAHISINHYTSSVYKSISMGVQQEL